MHVPVYEGEPKFPRPAVSRKLYNAKRAFMFHNIAPNGKLKYYFKMLSNTMTSFSDSSKTYAVQVYGTGVMSVKGYEREIFVAVSGLSFNKYMRFEFFALNADSEGNMTHEPLTALTHETPLDHMQSYQWRSDIATGNNGIHR